MSLSKPGWLEQILRGVAGGWLPDESSRSAAAALKLPVGRGRARRYLRGILRESGLLFGTPNLPALGEVDELGPEDQLFLAVLRVFARVALDVANLVEADAGPRAEQVLVLCAVLAGRMELAHALHLRIARMKKEGPIPEKEWLKVEEALVQRAGTLAADPYYGLVLHNGAVFADAGFFGRAAISYFASGKFERAVLERQAAFAGQQKARLVGVLVGLVSAERKPGFPARRAILRQIDELQLPEDLAEETRELARRAFDRPVPMKDVTKGLRSLEVRRFVVEQTLLASLVEGRRSPREVAWTQALGKQLAFSASELKTMELEMAEFYRQHRSVVDVFRLSSGAEVMGEEWVDQLSTTVRKNYRALLRELRQTGELSRLAARAARGQKLTPEEKALMRSQLIELAKAVPALAIFAAPGGVLLLIALAKVLPFDLRPASFREEPDEREG